MNVTCIVLGTLFCAAGGVFAMGKLHVHLPAWKSMSPEARSKVRIKPLCRNIGEMMGVSGLVFFMRGTWRQFTQQWFLYAMIIWVIAACLDVWYISKSGRYQSG